MTLDEKRAKKCAYMRKYRAEKAAEIKLWENEYRSKNKSRIAGNRKLRYWRNPEKFRGILKAWRRKNPARFSQLRKDSLLRNPDNYFGIKLRNRVRNALKSRRAIKLASTLELVGCSVAELRLHLESQFKPGMGWCNYGQWHIDHITPISFYNLTEEREQRQAFHWSNMQPLWAAENMAKGSKMTYDFFAV
jgi:hypothetical protein